MSNNKKLFVVGIMTKVGIEWTTVEATSKREAKKIVQGKNIGEIFRIREYKNKKGIVLPFYSYE